MNIIRNQKKILIKTPLISLVWILASGACSSAETKPTQTNGSETAQTTSAESTKLLNLLNNINDRIQALESKLTSLNDKIDSTRLTLDHMNHAQKVKAAEVIANQSETAGIPARPTPAPSDPEGGFINDDAVQNFRKSMIIFQGQKYPEAVLAFSSFLEKFPDHALAGSAQFYIGKAYMKQKEYKLALKEFQRVLTSYDRSTHVADTLSEMALAEEKLKRSDEATRHRQLLTSLFPHSPAAFQPVSKVEPEVTEVHTQPANTEVVEELVPPTIIPPTAPLVNREGPPEAKP